MAAPFEIFCATAPGFEPLLAEELGELDFPAPQTTPGGVSFQGHWPDVWRVNLMCRGASRVLVRIAGFPVHHLAQLDKRSRRISWADYIPSEGEVRVEATCRKSKIYHTKAAAERVAKALCDSLSVTLSDEAPLTLRLRIDNNYATISLDTSGDLLHKRGHKSDTAKAPMRENLAALFLRAAGFSGEEPVLDPMCGSGTFVLEAAEIASGLAPGRSRSFAFESLPGFDAAKWQKMRQDVTLKKTGHRFLGSDRNEGAINAARANSERAGVSALTSFTAQPITACRAPEGPRGLVITNPPYGDRIGNKRALQNLYAAFGNRMRDQFQGWRIALITNETALAKATGLPFKAPGPLIDHGGLKIRLWQTDCLP